MRFETKKCRYLCIGFVLVTRRGVLDALRFRAVLHVFALSSMLSVEVSKKS
jgi:hypothetical protein